MALLKVTDLKIGYSGNTVFDNLSFSVNSGDYLCIVGENGSGKTTLIKGILGLLQPYSGQVEYSDGLTRNHIGYLSQQQKLTKDFPASVCEVVMSGFLNKRIVALNYSKQEREEALSIMQRTGVDALSKKSFSELSGGQQQRVLLARALCAAKKLILLDEPTSALDPLATSEFYSVVKALNKEGMAVIMVSHDITSAVRNASHILHLSDNSYFFGTTHEYMHSEFGRKLLISDCPCDACAHNSTRGGCANA